MPISRFEGGFALNAVVSQVAKIVRVRDAGNSEVQRDDARRVDRHRCFGPPQIVGQREVLIKRRAAPGVPSFERRFDEVPKRAGFVAEGGPRARQLLRCCVERCARLLIIVEHRSIAWTAIEGHDGDQLDRVCAEHTVRSDERLCGVHQRRRRGAELRVRRGRSSAGIRARKRCR